MPPAVTYGLLAGCGLLLAFGLFLDSQRAEKIDALKRVRAFAIVVQIAAVVLAYFVLRPGRAADPRVAMQQSAAAKEPIFLDLYSNY